MFCCKLCIKAFDCDVVKTVQKMNKKNGKNKEKLKERRNYNGKKMKMRFRSKKKREDGQEVGFINTPKLMKQVCLNRSCLENDITQMRQ